MDDQENQEMMQELMFLCCGLMLGAAARNQSMVQLEMDPGKAAGLELENGAGRIMVVIAGGPSIPKLKQALDLVIPMH